MTRALIVPDEASWTMWGRDPRGAGLALVEAPERAAQLLVPDPIPAPLVEAVQAAWARMPAPRRHLPWPRGLGGVPVSEVLMTERPSAPAAGHDEHADADSHHDHHDMMAIVGEPSADGLVMESIEFEIGPLASGLPGGLILGLSLDGDVVERCEPRGTLTMSLGPMTGGADGDPLASAAWTTAIALALERDRGTRASEAAGRLRIAAVETERALSHLCWLRAFGLILGWAQLRDLAHAAAVALMPARKRSEEAAARLDLGGPERDELVAGLESAAREAQPVRRLLDGSRRLRARTRGRAETPAARIAGTEVGGPVARAAGISRDARSEDSLHRALGFREATLGEGDAEARTLVRVAETAAALDVAGAALSEEGNRDPAGAGDLPGVVVEGPRGPVRASLAGARLAVGAPGSNELLRLAGEAVIGLEIGRALAGLASFDLSGWRVSQ